MSGTTSVEADGRSEPLVDVCIPAYKRPGYIVEAIASVKAQTFERWRLTISDDGPGGEEVGAAVAPFLSDERIRYLPTGQRIGEMLNWTRCLGLSEARYVALLHDDDRWHPSFLERRVAVLEAHPECGFVFSGTNRIDHEGRWLGTWSPPVAERVYSSREFARLLLEANVVGPPPSVLVRRSAYDAAGAEFRCDFPHSDYEMWYRLALRFPVAYIDSHDVDYRVHLNSTSYLERPDVEAVLRFRSHFVELADSELPELLDERARARIRGRMLLPFIAFDALGPGSRRYSTRLLVEAVKAYPPVLLDERAVDWLRIMVGPRVRRRIARLRASVRRRPSIAALPGR
jgi:glycosyltransferase involved in cell wall biosynthesis